MHLRQRGDGSAYYLCGTAHPMWRRRTGKEAPECSHHYHAAGPLEALVWDETVELFSDPNRLARAAGLGSEAKADDTEKAIGTAEKSLAGLEREAQNLMRLYRRGLASEAHLERSRAPAS